MAKKPPSLRTLQRRRRQLQDRLETLIYQRDFFLDEAETLRLLPGRRKISSWWRVSSTSGKAGPPELFDSFREVVVADFEFAAFPGERRLHSASSRTSC